MATSEKIVAALRRIKKITSPRETDIIRSVEMSRSDRELLIKTKWLQEIMKGWYMLTRPDIPAGDSTSWYANFWDFLRIYLPTRFGNNYCLSAESSLDLYTQIPTIPKQVIVVAPKGGSNNYSLLHNTFLLVYADKKNFPQERIVFNGLQVLPLETALCKVSDAYFKNNPENAEIALRLIKDPSELSKTIIRFNCKKAANRLIGAYQFFAEDNFVQTIKNDLTAVGIPYYPENPFQQSNPLISIHTRIKSPYAARIEALWTETREQIIKIFPKDPGISKNPKKYLTHIEEIYKEDAYNSLSIEGYNVTPELIDRVKNNKWNPDSRPEDRFTRNALAAKGYYEAFQEVKKTVKAILYGKKPGEALVQDLQNWYQKLFLPSVQAGIIPAEHLVGYRNSRIYIRGSRHVPPPKEAVLDSMETLFACIKQETSAAVRAILGHYLLVFIHPYMDGNGRISRFLMNVMFASGGYPWTVIEIKKRSLYFDALKIADEERNLEPFAKFVLKEMKKIK